MKARPLYLIRFRHEEQFAEIRRLAKRAEISMNEWLLRKIEAEPGKPQREKP